MSLNLLAVLLLGIRALKTSPRSRADLETDQRLLCISKFGMLRRSSNMIEIIIKYLNDMLNECHV